MQTNDVVIAITAALEAFMERFVLGEKPSEEVIRQALCAGLRALAERAAIPGDVELAALRARVDQAERSVADLVKIMQGIQDLAAASESVRDAVYQKAESERDAQVAAAEEARQRRFEERMIEQSLEFRLSLALWSEEMEKSRAAPAREQAQAPALEASPQSAVLDAVVELTRTGMSAAEVRRWLVRRSWTRKTHRGAALRQIVTRLRACPEETLTPVVELVLSDTVWPEMIAMLGEIEARRAATTAMKDPGAAPIVDLVREGERRKARARR